MINSISQRQLSQLILAHFKEIIREPGVIFWGIIFPILMALGLGIAFTKKTDFVRTIAVVNQTTTSPQMLTSLGEKIPEVDVVHRSSSEKESNITITLENEKLGNTTYEFIPVSWEDAMVLLKRGNINLILEEKEDHLRYHFDPMNPEAQLNYLKLTRLFGGGEKIALEQPDNIDPLTVTGTRYIDFLIPGLIAMGIMMSCMWGISYGLIDKRTKKLLRRMVATPMKKSNLLVAIITVRLGMNIIEAVLLFLFAYFFFNISIQGGILALALIFLAGNIAFSGIAIFTSSRTANTEIGNGLINAVVLPMMVLSGIFFSYHNFPQWAVAFIQWLPLTLLADYLRSVFIEGAGLSQVFIPSAILCSVGVIFFSLGLRTFRWY